MYIVQQTETFIKWRVKDIRARVAIARRIERAQAGNLGDHKSIEKNVSEMRLSIGPGYRIYYTQRGANLIILLVGGEKSSQQKDITRESTCKGILNMAERLIPFDMASFLDSDEAIAEYLSQVLADGDSDELLAAIGHIAKAHGISQIAKDSGIARDSLYKALSPGSRPRFETIIKVLSALGVHLRASANT